MSEWKEEIIVEEFHASKQKTLDTYEEDARFFYIEQKGDDEQMNKFVLQIIQNLQISIDRVYLRIEDPYPFALGVLIPSISVKTADRAFNVVSHVERPEIAFKIVRIEDLSIFMERDEGEVSIDSIIRLHELDPESPDFHTIREQRIYEHIHSMFQGIDTDLEDTQRLPLGGQR